MDPFNTVFVVIYRETDSYEELIVGIFEMEERAQKAIKKLREKHPDWLGSFNCKEYPLNELCDEP